MAFVNRWQKDLADVQEDLRDEMVQRKQTSKKSSKSGMCELGPLLTNTPYANWLGTCVSN